MNPYLHELYQLANNRFSIDTENMSYSDWIVQNTTLKSRPFSFDKHVFQEAIVNDMHPNLSCIKPSQVGLTEVQIRKMLAFLSRHRGVTTLYSFPDDDMRKRNSQTRVQPILDADKVFNPESTGSDKPIRSIALNQIGTSFMHLTGSKEGDATSTAVDFMINDEIDLTDQEMLALFSSRLQASEWKIRQQFSTPTYTGYGVDLLFQASDQMEFMIKCGCCNHWQAPRFTPSFIDIPGLPDIPNLLEIDQGMIDTYNLDILSGEIVCEKCRAPLDIGRRDNREWVAKYPSRKHSRGYRVTPFCVRSLNVGYIVSELLKYKQRDALHRFNNIVLGEAVDNSNNRLNEEDIRKIITAMPEVPSINHTMYTWIGIDVGLTCWITLGQGTSQKDVKVVLIEAVPQERLVVRVVELYNTYNIVGGLMDRHPYTPTAEEIRDKTYGAVMPCEYRGEKEFNLIKGPEGETLYYQADRTAILDTVAKAVRQRWISISGYGMLHSVIITHLRNMVREEEPETKAVWKKLSPEDHIFHSLGFMLGSIKARDLEDIKTGVPQSTIAVMGVDMQGHNTNMLGQKTKWQNHFLNATIWRNPSSLLR